MVRGLRWIFLFVQQIFQQIERFYPPVAVPVPSTSTSGGTVHLVVGDGGNYEGPAIYEGHPSGWRQPQPLWSAFREASYGPGVGWDWMVVV